MTKYKFYNYSKLVKEDGGRKRFDWCLFLNETKDIINQIDYVKYMLHPTFPNPERIMRSNVNKFALYSNGWGTFSIYIEIRFHDGRIGKDSYYLDLQVSNWPSTSIDDFQMDETTNQVYDVILSSNFNWRKLETIMNRSSLPKKTSFGLNPKIGRIELDKEVTLSIYR